jgi:hypothetical protein
MGEAEARRFLNAIGVSSGNFVGYKFRQEGNTLTPVTSTGNTTELKKGVLKTRLAEGSHDIAFIYGPEATFDFKSSTKGKDTSIHALASKFLREVYGEDYVNSSEGADILKNPWKYFIPTVYRGQSDKSAWARDFKNMPKHRRPKRNVPYLVFHSPKGHKLYIRLTPTPFKKDSRVAHEIGLPNIYDFIEEVEKFEKLLENSKLPEPYKRLKMGKGVQLSTASTYYPFHTLVNVLAKHKNRNKAAEVPTSLFIAKNAKLKEHFPDIDVKNLSKELLESAAKIDALIHGEVKAGTKREYQGPAQLAFDAIASKNFIVSLPNGKNVLLRDYTSEQGIREGSPMVKPKGRSLAGVVKMEGDNGLSYNPAISTQKQEALKKRLTAYKQGLIKRGMQNTPRYAYVDGLLNNLNQHLDPFTLQDLKDLFGARDSGDFSNICSKARLFINFYSMFNKQTKIQNHKN